VDVKNWIIVCADKDVVTAEKVRGAYVSAASSIGIKVADGTIVQVKSNRPCITVNEFLKAIRDATIIGEVRTQFLYQTSS